MKPISMRYVRLVLALFFSTLFARGVFAAAAGSLHGHVIGPDGRALPGVSLELRNDITGFRSSTQTDGEGVYQFFNVPFNPYWILVEVQGFEPVSRPVDVRSAAAGVPRSPQ